MVFRIWYYTFRFLSGKHIVGGRPRQTKYHAKLSAAQMPARTD